MYIPTGKPRGRPKGTQNKRTGAIKQAVAKAAERLEAAIPDAFVGDAHAFLVSIYKDPQQPLDLRMEAAGKAIRYEKPALAAVAVKDMNRRDVHDFTTAELEQFIADSPEGQAILAARDDVEPGRKH